MSPAFALRYACRNLVRGGQRTLLAAVCVAFGVMSLVGLQMLSSMIAASIAVDPRAVLGGDAALSRTGRNLREQDVAALGRMRARGEIAAYTLTTPGGAALCKKAGTGQVYLLGRSEGVDPATFPLVGEARVARPAGATLGSLIATPGTAAVTRDVAERVGLAPGDALTLAGPEGAPARLRVAGIVDLPPDRQGDTVFYSLATARRLIGREDVAASAQVLWGTSPPPLAALAARGWAVVGPEAVAKRRGRVADLFGLMLKGAGILGLLLGGLGVANTLQVLMARRRLEIATLKTLGYERRHLVLLFGLEAGLLGALGGVGGAAAGAALSLWLRALLGRVGPILLGPAIDPWVLAGGAATGVATALLFGLHAIVRASAVRPATLLRDLPAPRAWRETAVLYAALGALFSALASGVMGSVLYGVGVVVAGAAGLALLVVLLGSGLVAAVALPVPLPRLLALARRSLRRNAPRAQVALVALFCGVFTIGFAAAAIQNGRARLASQSHARRPGPNVTVYAAATDAPRIAAALSGAGATEVKRTARPGQASLSATVAAGRLDALVETLRREAPDALVVKQEDLAAALDGAIRNLFAFVVAVAGLALVAGGVLIANSVSLAMLDRRRELGIFKAIGYSSGRILAGIAAEYALLGLLAGLAGMAAVALAFLTIDRLRPAAQLTLDPLQAPLMVAVAVAIALASAVAVAWKPTHARPLEVLRQEG